LFERIKLNDSEIFIAEADNNNLVGFIQLYPLFSSTRMQLLWLLNDLFVDMEYRGKGIAKQLIDKAKNHCIQTNACGLILETEKKEYYTKYYKEYYKNYNQINKDKIKLYYKNYNQINKDKIKLYYEINKDKIKERNKRNKEIREG
jgi:GNAT superfamily N-acetyltransferase